MTIHCQLHIPNNSLTPLLPPQWIVARGSSTRRLFIRPFNTLVEEIEFAKMEKLGNYNSNIRDCLANIGSIESKFIEEKILSWSSSVFSKLSYNNLRDTSVFVGSLLEPNNLECKLRLWSTSVSSYIEDNPIIFSLPTEFNISGEAVQTYVNLPYLGAVSLDVFLFSSSTIISRAYMFWRSRR